MEDDRSSVVLQDQRHHPDAEICHRYPLCDKHLDIERRPKDPASADTYVWSYFASKSVLMTTVPDGAPIVPYTIWGNNLKVVLRVNAELRYHDVTPDSRPIDVVKTQWVNYIFADETGRQSTILL